MCIIYGSAFGQPPAPLPAVPVAAEVGQADYQLGPGDTVRITVWNGNDYSEQNLTLAADGTLLVPFSVNKLLQVSGLTAIQLRDLIQTELQRVFIHPIAQVLITGFESKKAFLLGEVSTPGYFPIAGKTQILEFMVRRGGFLPRSNLTEVQVIHAGGERHKVNVYDIVLKGDQSQNVTVLPGDIIFVPSVESAGKRYFILGEVRQPGLIQTQEDLTLLELIARAGTLANTAQASRIFLVRQDAGGKSEVKEIAFSDLYRKGDFSRNVPLKSGDIVFVPKNMRTRITDVLNVLTPIVSFIRDTVILADIANRQNP